MTETAEIIDDGLPLSLVRRAVNLIAVDRGEWGGYPIPVEHVELVMEPRFPMKGLNGLRLNEPVDKPKQEADDYTVLNQWYCFARHATVVVCRESNGKSRPYFISEGPGKRLNYWINTLGVCAGEVWEDDTEDNAERKLRSLVTDHAFKCYRFVGGFFETSPRSKVTYLFRKLRPTLALRPDRFGNMEVIAVLCLHPLGYYAQSWAGVMTPTDDVIAHLLMMRADEHQFWKKANHHSMHEASAGI